MLAIVVPSEREFCVDYACRCRVMCSPPILLSLTQLVLTPIMKHPRITHFDVFSFPIPHSHQTIVARNARFVSVRSPRVSELRYGYILAPTCLTPPTYILV